MSRWDATCREPINNGDVTSRQGNRLNGEADESVLNALPPLLELFAVVDDVFTEDEAFAPENLRAGLGRIYRQWKKSRKVLDPDFADQGKQYSANDVE